MRDITPASVMAARSALVRPVAEVTSWLGAQYLGEVPVIGGSAVADLTVIGGELELQVPNVPEWVPAAPDHPLSNFGQELLVRKGWAAPDGTVKEWASIGRYLVHDAVPEGDTITVRADGLGQRIEHARFTDPLTLPAGQFIDQARELLLGTGLAVSLDLGFASRSSVSRTFERGESRAEAWAELMTAWGAVSRIDPDSRTVVVRAPYPTSGNPVVSLADGVGGALVDIAPGGGPEDGTPNAVVASSAPEDGSVPLSAIAMLHVGPRRWNGPYGQRPAFYTSPLLVTRAQVASAARTRLQSMTTVAWDITVDSLSCPATEPGDLIDVTSTDQDTQIVGQAVQTRVALGPDDEPGQTAVHALRGVLGGVPL